MLFLRSLHICDGYFYSLHSLFGSVPYIFFRILTRAPHENCFFRSLFISINSSAIFWDHGFPASSVFFLKYLNRWTLHSPCPVPKWYNAVSWSWIRVPVYFLKKSISPNSPESFPLHRLIYNCIFYTEVTDIGLPSVYSYCRPIRCCNFLVQHMVFQVGNTFHRRL